MFVRDHISKAQLLDLYCGSKILKTRTFINEPETLLCHVSGIILFKLHLDNYTFNQLRYELRKMKAHGLIQRNGKHYSYHLAEKGMKIAAMFMLFHKHLCGPLASSLFHHRPDKIHIVNSKLEKAYHKADDSIKKIIDLMAA